MSWLPPDQIATSKWPVIGERAPLPEALDPATWSLTIGGAVDTPLQLTGADLQQWPQQPITMDVHCVTRWSRRAVQFAGCPLADVLADARIKPEATTVRFVAWSQRDHDTSLPLAMALRDCWLVTHADGAPLTVAHGGPLRLITPGRYFYKSLKWVRRIELQIHGTLGYWERTDGYHNTGDPWPGDQRYVSGSLDDAALVTLRAATDFTRWRRSTIRRAELPGWQPTAPLGAIKLKGCNLRSAQLRSQDLAGASLSLSDLRGADLRDADLRGADLEGAYLQDADLRGADLRGALLTGATWTGAQLDGAQLDSAQPDPDSEPHEAGL